MVDILEFVVDITLKWSILYQKNLLLKSEKAIQEQGALAVYWTIYFQYFKILVKQRGKSQSLVTISFLFEQF